MGSGVKAVLFYILVIFLPGILFFGCLLLLDFLSDALGIVLPKWMLVVILGLGVGFIVVGVNKSIYWYAHWSKGMRGK
ncbi:hypothetical protein [Microbulbifer sp. JMSA003]|uniref:hypothetical protein n=1 Tax=Microbulbifer sp. JMSA003 TaxID=3243369 RepID=UPI0040397630